MAEVSAEVKLILGGQQQSMDVQACLSLCHLCITGSARKVRTVSLPESHGGSVMLRFLNGILRIHQHPNLLCAAQAELNIRAISLYLHLFLTVDFYLPVHFFGGKQLCFCSGICTNCAQVGIISGDSFLFVSYQREPCFPGTGCWDCSE